MDTNNKPLDYSGCYMTRIIRNSPGARLPGNHRAEVILHDGQWYFGEYANLDQLRDFAAAVGGFSWSLHHSDRLELERIGDAWKPCEPYTIEYYTLSHRFDVDAICHDTQYGRFPGFWTLDEVPAGAVPFVGLSNGSLVTCYATNDGETIRLFRPNPNAKEVYKPLSLEAHIAYRKAHGDMGPVCFAPNISGDCPSCPSKEIARIINNCERYTLDPVFEDYGNFVNHRPEWLDDSAKKYAGCVNFWGNFYDFSGVFSVITNDAAVISRLTEAIRRNQATAEYAAAKAEIKARGEA